VQIEVPPGIGAGDQMEVSYEGQVFTVLVPDGVSAGMLIDLDLPVGDAAPDHEPAPATSMVQVVVPEGLWRMGGLSIHGAGIMGV
jgi:hypothetical protein